MFYPHRPNYKCPDCKEGVMKWEGMEFHGSYVLGYHFCNNPQCINSRENVFINLSFEKPRDAVDEC